MLLYTNDGLYDDVKSITILSLTFNISGNDNIILIPMLVLTYAVYILFIFILLMLRANIPFGYTTHVSIALPYAVYDDIFSKFIG